MDTVFVSNMPADAARVLFLTPAEWLQVGALIAMVVYVIITFRIHRSNALSAESTVRPVVGVSLLPMSELAHVWFGLRNYTSNDAVGLVDVRLIVNGQEHAIDAGAYAGKQVWNFPARQSCAGHKEFSGLLKKLQVLTDTKSLIELQASLYYVPFSGNPSLKPTGCRYYAPVRKWHWAWDRSVWVADLTSESVRIPVSPDWTVLDKRPL